MLKPSKYLATNLLRQARSTDHNGSYKTGFIKIGSSEDATATSEHFIPSYTSALFIDEFTLDQFDFSRTSSGCRITSISIDAPQLGTSFSFTMFVDKHTSIPVTTAENTGEGVYLITYKEAEPTYLMSFVPTNAASSLIIDLMLAGLVRADVSETEGNVTATFHLLHPYDEKAFAPILKFHRMANVNIRYGSLRLSSEDEKVKVDTMQVADFVTTDDLNINPEPVQVVVPEAVEEPQPEAPVEVEVEAPAIDGNALAAELKPEATVVDGGGLGEEPARGETATITPIDELGYIPAHETPVEAPVQQ